MSGTPAFASTVQTAGTNISVANTGRDGTGSLGTLYSAPTSGARVDDIKIKARGATTAGMIRFFLYDGATYRFITEILVSAITPSGTVAAFEYTLYDLGWCLQSGWSIKVATNNAESFDVTMTRGGSF